MEKITNLFFCRRVYKSEIVFNYILIIQKPEFMQHFLFKADDGIKNTCLPLGSCPCIEDHANGPLICLLMSLRESEEDQMEVSSKVCL
jgi:hypothetical protein